MSWTCEVITPFLPKLRTNILCSQWWRGITHVANQPKIQGLNKQSVIISLDFWGVCVWGTYIQGFHDRVVMPKVVEPKDFREHQRRAVKAQPWHVENPGLIRTPSAGLGPLVTP